MSTILTPQRGTLYRRDEWLNSTCRSFSETTGWTLAFTSAANLRRVEQETLQLNCSWYCELTDGNRPTGLVHLTPPEDLNALLTFESACQLAELLAENINRFLHQQSQFYEQAFEIGMLLGTNDASDHRNRLRALLRAASCISNFRAAALFVLEPDGSAVRLRLSHHLSLSDIPAPQRDLNSMPPDLQSLDSGLVLVRRDEDKESLWLPDSMNSGVCLPIQSESGPIGTLWLFDRRSKDSSELPTDLLRGFARQMADVFERIVLLQDSDTCERLTRELDVIASTTDDIREVTASYPGCDVAVRCLSRCEVGGDLCEIVPLDEHRTIFVIGDASGDSIPAATVMTATRGALHALLESCRTAGQTPSPPDFVGELNRAILQVTAAQQFITLIFGILDDRTRTLEYTNAGHCPPLHIHDGQTTVLDSQGLLLGVLEDADYSSDTVQLEPDHQLIFFSDGIVEARDLNENMFRDEGVLNAIEGRPCQSALQTLLTIWGEYEIHTAGRNLDDRTLMVIRGAEPADGDFADHTFSGSQQVY